MADSRSLNVQTTAAKRTATAYVITFMPLYENEIGHTSLYVEGSDGTFFERSFFPSTRTAAAFARHLSLGFVPVYGFITRNIQQDVRIEKAPPSTIHKITNLDYEAMLQENAEFSARVGNGNHGFSLRYTNMLNPFNWLYSLKGAWQEHANMQARTSVPALISEDPFSGAIMSLSEDRPEISLGNCTEAVERSLHAGGFLAPQKSFLHRFFSSALSPEQLQNRVIQANFSDVMGSEDMPENLKMAIADGELQLEKRDAEQEKADEELYRFMSRNPV